MFSLSTLCFGPLLFYQLFLSILIKKNLKNNDFLVKKGRKISLGDELRLENYNTNSWPSVYTYCSSQLIPNSVVCWSELVTFMSLNYCKQPGWKITSRQELAKLGQEHLVSWLVWPQPLWQDDCSAVKIKFVWWKSCRSCKLLATSRTSRVCRLIL